MYARFWNEPDHHFWSGDQSIAWREAYRRRLVEGFGRMYAVTAEVGAHRREDELEGRPVLRCAIGFVSGSLLQGIPMGCY